jgi:hypothetical protein
MKKKRFILVKSTFFSRKWLFLSAVALNFENIGEVKRRFLINKHLTSLSSQKHHIEKKP